MAFGPWIQPPDFTVQTQSGRATFPTLTGSADDEALGTSPDNYTNARTVLAGLISGVFGSVQGPGDDSVMFSGPGPATFPATDYASNQVDVDGHAAIGDIFDNIWEETASGSYESHGVETRPANPPTYEDGPGIQFESNRPTMTANINVTITYWLDFTDDPGVSITGVGGFVDVYAYTMSDGNNAMIEPFSRTSILTDVLAKPDPDSGATQVTMDVTFNAGQLADWDYGNGVMFYPVLRSLGAPNLAALSSHNQFTACHYEAWVQINPDPSVSYWVVRPPRYREVVPDEASVGGGWSVAHTKRVG